MADDYACRDPLWGSPENSFPELLVSAKDKFQVFFYNVAAPVLAIGFIFGIGFFIKRKRKFLKIWKGKPGIPAPVKLFDEQRDRMDFVFCFCFLIWIIGYHAGLRLIHPQTDSSNFPTYAKALLTMKDVVVYGLLLYPIFAAFTLHNWLVYLLAAIYFFFHVLIILLLTLPCEPSELHPMAELRKVSHTLRYVFTVVLMIILSFSLVKSLAFRAFKLFTARKQKPTDPIEVLKTTFQYQHTKRLLLVHSDEGRLREAKINDILRSRLYKRLPGFQYPIAILTSFFGALLLCYFITTSLIHHFIATPEKQSGINDRYVGPILRACLAWDRDWTWDPIPTSNSTALAASSPSHLQFIVTSCVSLLLALGMTASALLLGLKNYRTHILAIYKGEYGGKMVRYNWSPAKILVNSFKYVGFQIGSAVLGFIVQSMAVFILIRVFILLYRLLQVQWKEIVSILTPAVLFVSFIFLCHHICVRLFFQQQDDHKRRLLALDNIRAFHLYQFVMFVPGIVFGVLLSMWRLATAAVVGLWALPRLDVSILGRDFEFLDDGFGSYIGFLKTMNLLTNPIMVVFVKFLCESVEIRGIQATEDEDESSSVTDERPKIPDEGPKRHKLIRNRWNLYVTLFNNPQLQLQRGQRVGWN